MAPWEWAVLGTFGAAMAVLGAVWLLRRTRRGRAVLGLSMREKARFGQELLRDPFIPTPAKILVALLVGYLVLPLDLIPDFVPFVGHLDDFAVVAVVVALLLRLVPPTRIDRAIVLAREPMLVGDERQRLPESRRLEH